MIKAIGPKFRRAVHFDCHTCPGVKDAFSGFDAEAFAKKLSDAHIEYINFTARCNMGFSYYNTKVGKKYEGLGDRDLLQETIDACRKRGIGVTAYINVALNHELAADRRDWLRIFSGGRIHHEDKKDNFFREMCYNSPYRQYLFDEIKEILKYDIDGIFFDCVTARKCYCEHCLRDMKKRGFDPDNSDSAYEYAVLIKDELCEEMKELADASGKKLKVFTNGSPWQDKYVTHVEIECLVTGPWGYDCFDPMGAYVRTIAEDRVFMSGRFQNSWGDLGGIKSLPSMQNDLYDAMLNGFAISFGDHLHPVTGLEDEVIKRIGAVLEERMLYEPYIDNADKAVEVGVLMGSNPRNIPDYVQGISRMLNELKIAYNVFWTRDGYDIFDKVKLIIVGEELGDCEELKEKMLDFSRRGGRLLFVGAGVSVGKRLGLLEYTESVEDDTSDNAYYTVDENNMRWAMYRPSKLIKNKSGTELARYVSNMFNFIWDGRQSYFYRPQGDATEYSAAVVGERSACVCFDIFGAYAEAFMQEHKKLVEKIFDMLLPDRLIKTSGMPQSTTVSVTQNEEYKVLHVKATHPDIRYGKGVVEEHSFMRSAEVSLLGEYDVYSLPEMAKIDARKENGRTVFMTGDILGYKAFLIK